MGPISSSQADRFTIAFNKKLNAQLIQNLNVKSSKSEVRQFKRFMNKQLDNGITRSNLSSTIESKGKAFDMMINLLDVINAKSVKRELLLSSSHNIYSTVFNYNIIPKESIEYERFNKKTIALFECIITGEAHDYNTSYANSSFNSPSKGRDIGRLNNINNTNSNFLHSDSLFSKSKLIKLQSTNNNSNKPNDTSSDNEIITSMLDVHSIKPSSTFRSYNKLNKVIGNVNVVNGTLSRRGNQPEDTETINLADDSFNNFCISEERQQLNENSEHIIEFDNPDSSKIDNSSKIKAKKHRAMPTKAPLVNIKLKINDLIKQGIYEDSVLEPYEKYKDPDKERPNRNKKGKGQYKFNQTNAYHLNISTDINDITMIKPDTSVANVNDNASFLSIVDVFTQANKKTKHVIHSKTPAKSKVMKNPNYLKSAPSKSNDKTKSSKKKIINDSSYYFNF